MDWQGICDSDWIRTNDPQLRRLMLYPAELPNHSQLDGKYTSIFLFLFFPYLYSSV